MSPAVMDQRRVESGVRYIPPSPARAAEPIPNGTESANTVAFERLLAAEKDRHD
jgi:hypothetical protein